MAMECSLHCPLWFQDACRSNTSVLADKRHMDHLSLFGHLSFSFFFVVIHSLKMAAQTLGIIFIFKIGRLGKVEFEWFTLPRMEKT